MRAPLHKPPHHEQPHRRHLSHWAAHHAWKLAGLTAVVTFVGVFIAVTLSLILRPTRSYFFPLLSDVDKHQPEGAILRIAFAAATALLFATTTASVLHCHSLRLFDRPAVTHEHDDVSVVDDAFEITPNPPLLKRRALRFTTLQIIIVVPLCLLILLTFSQYSGLTKFLYQTVRRRLIVKLGLYALCFTWATAMCFLVWYFLKLQNMPDRNAAELPTQADSSLTESSYADMPDPPETRRIWARLRQWASWCVVILRPICLTGQVVCIIKIVGLWLALDTFSISNIRLVKIALLAALAFAEYTAAFFFSFFMTILAVDMRAKTTPPEFSLQT